MSDVSETDLEEALKLNRILAARLSPRLADDLVSAGNYAIVKGLATYQGGKGAKFKTYIYPSIKNRQLMELLKIGSPVSIPRRDKGQERLDFTEFQSAPVDEAAPMFAPEASETGAIDVLEPILGNLSQKDRELIVGHFYERKSYRQLGRERNRSQHTIYIHMQRILARMRTRLPKRNSD